MGTLSQVRSGRHVREDCQHTTKLLFCPENLLRQSCEPASSHAGRLFVAAPARGNRSASEARSIRPADLSMAAVQMAASRILPEPQPGGSAPAAACASNEDLQMIDTLFDLFGTFYERGEFLQAERIARSIQQAVPDDVVSLQFLGLLYYRSQRHAEALEAFDMAARNLLDGGARGSGDSSLGAARQCLRAAQRRGSALAGVWYDLGLVLLRLRRHPQATGAFRSALSVWPNFRAAQRAIARTTEFSGRQGKHRPPADDCSALAAVGSRRDQG